MAFNFPLKTFNFSIKILLIAIGSVAFSTITCAQSVDFGSFKGNPFKIGGSASANSTFLQSSRNSGNPFVYNLTGNINVSFYSFSMPISYNFTNLGGKLNYQIPFNFNRLSISPKYKWITAHIGDVSMTFSPYSLAGHQFTGGGIELSPNSPLKFSAMYGRFLKAVEDSDNPNSIPSFERWGYGSKIDYVKSKYKAGLVGFYAKDLVNSLAVLPTKKEITPKENLVVGLTFESQISEKLKLYADYSNSSVVQNTLAIGSGNKSGLSSLFINGNSSLQNFNALKVGFDYKIKKTSLGASFERVDPNYQTLGAYFFANDLQNIMVNVARPIFSDKISLTLNLGVQKDNLDNKKAQTTNRLIGGLNINAKFSENLTSSLNLTNQTTTSDVNPDQFLQINQVNPELNNVTQINYRQLSRSAALSTVYNFKASKSAKRNITFNYAFNQVANEQGGIIRLGQLSSFHNFSSSYSHQFLKSKWALNSSANLTLSTIGAQNTSTFGPVIGLNKKFLKDKLVTQFSTAYNTSKSEKATTNNFNFRITSGYKLFDSHSFNLTASQIFSSTSTSSSVAKPNVNELTITFGYNYNFAAKKKKEEVKKTTASVEKEKISVTLNNEKLDASASTIKTKLTAITDTLKTEFTPSFKTKITNKKDSISVLLTKFDAEKDVILKNKIQNLINNSLENFDKEVNTFNNFKNNYKSLIANANFKLKNDTKEKAVFSKRYFINKYKLNIESKGDTAFEDIVEIENQILKDNLKIEQKDLFSLAHFNLMYNLLQAEKANIAYKQNTEIANLENDLYYNKFLTEKKLEQYTDDLEVKFADTFIKQYLQKFTNNIKTK